MSEEKEVFEYTIGNSVYIQKKMTLGQVKQLNKLFGVIEMPGTFSALTMFTAFSDKLSNFMGIVLCKKDTMLKDKVYDEVVQAMDDAGDLDVAFQVVQDFFVCNPIATYFDQMTSALKQVITAGRPNSQLTSGSTE